MIDKLLLELELFAAVVAATEACSLFFVFLCESISPFLNTFFYYYSFFPIKIN